MAKIDWSSQPNAIKSGLSHGVLYPSSGSGVPWSGLISATENRIAPEAASVFLDGQEIGHNIRPGHYQLSLVCYDHPVEFAACIGDKNYAPGLFLTGQPKERFGLSYRTYYNRESVVEYHVVYNASAHEASYATSSDTETITPNQHTFVIDTIPVEGLLQVLAPSGHYKIPLPIGDVRIGYLERYLYGSSTNEPMLPTPEQLGEILLNGVIS